MATSVTPSKGAKPDKLMRDALIVALNREATGHDGKPTKRLYVIAEKLAAKAEEGDTAAIKEVFDRVDGKAAQPIGGDPENPMHMVHEIVRRIVRPGDNASS